MVQFVVGEGVSFASLHPFLHPFLAGSVLLNRCSMVAEQNCEMRWRQKRKILHTLCAENE